MTASDIRTGPDGLPVMCPSHREVFDVLLRRHANGHTDTTDREIQEVLERLTPGRRIEIGSISARVREMNLLGFVLESPTRRRNVGPHGVKGVLVRATYVPPGLRGKAVASGASGGAFRAVDIASSAGADVGCY